MGPSKNVRVSQGQQETLLNYMMQHENFATGKLVGPLGRQKSKEMWQCLAYTLNSAGNGACKDAAKWQQTWNDWKISVKTKVCAIRLHANGTGGGPPITKLTDLEEKLMALYGWHRVDGIEGVSETFNISTGVDVVEDSQYTFPLGSVVNVEYLDPGTDIIPLESSASTSAAKTDKFAALLSSDCHTCNGSLRIAAYAEHCTRRTLITGWYSYWQKVCQAK